MALTQTGKLTDTAVSSPAFLKWACNVGPFRPTVIAQCSHLVHYMYMC